jgi:NAD(P)-dependent dehydrogenase (short-subunit alcohol dehydrogenase family)
VTGAAKRIGRAIALELAKQGVHIVLHYNQSETEVENTADDVRACGVNAWTVQTDLNNLDQATALFTTAKERAGQLDILINSASIFPQNRISDFCFDDFLQNMTINALAPLWLCRAFAQQDVEGVIINLLDTRILDYDADHAAYHLSKRTLFTLTKILSLEFAPAIRVNGVAPGLILAPPGKDEAYLEQRKHTNLLERIGRLQDITEAVLFLVRSDFITGQVIYIDGGRHLKGTVYGT